MASTVIGSSTSSSTLHLELLVHELLDRVTIRPVTVAGQIERMGWVVGLATAIGGGYAPDAAPHERARRSEPELVRAHYGSPLACILGIPTEVSGSAAAMAFLIYSVKRLWGIDLELRTHREDLRRQYFRAKERAERAQAQAEEAARKNRNALSGLQERRVLRKIDQSEDWGTGVTSEVKRLGQSPKQWVGEEAVWFLED